ncbi:hypothetical protein DIPPA_25192 [Diplonema papillatum]|nr:hypothetical protein DIPPA_25192 [Diplonema papillatum]
MEPVSRTQSEPKSSAHVVDVCLEVENQLLRTQLATLSSTLRTLKEADNEMQTKCQHETRQRRQLQNKIMNLEADKTEAANLRDKVIMLEAEVERLGMRSQQVLNALAASEVEVKEGHELIAKLQQEKAGYRTTLEALGAPLKSLLVHSGEITRILLPSFKITEIGSTHPSEYVGDLKESMLFLQEVAQARSDAMQLVREKMKQEIMDHKANAGLAEHKEEVLQESLKLAEQNAAKERELHATRIAQLEARARQQADELLQHLQKKEDSLAESSKQLSISRTEKQTLDKTISDLQDTVTQCEEQLKKEARARAHLQKVLLEEQKLRLVAEKQLRDFKERTKLCGVDMAYRLNEEDLMSIVRDLCDSQGALELENCFLRDKLDASKSEGFASLALPEEVEEPPLAEQVAVAAEDSLADTALTEALLWRNREQHKNAANVAS